jgi:alkylation response protein AidB-like acyl-CoA dehydrogenase
LFLPADFIRRIALLSSFVVRPTRCWLDSPLADEMMALLPPVPEVQQARFPWAWWRAAADQGLSGMAVDTTLGGRGGDLAALWALAERLGRAAWPVNLSLAALFEALVVHHYFGHLEAPPDLRDVLLSGEALAAVATSEPEVGANPKLLATRAAWTGAGWRLSGVKSPITHGLDASIFLVLAITGEEAGRRQFSVFAVPRTIAGVTVEALSGPLAGHARVNFAEVEVGPETLLGTQGAALEQFARPFRLREQGLLLAYALGLASGLVDAVATTVPASPAQLGEAMAAVAALGATLAHLARYAEADARFEAMSTGALGQLKTVQELLLPQARASGVAAEPVAALQQMTFFLLRGQSRSHDRLGRSLLNQTSAQGV